MSEYLPEEEHAEYKNWCSHCINEGDSECCWCRDDTPDGVPSMYDDGQMTWVYDDVAMQGGPY